MILGHSLQTAVALAALIFVNCGDDDSAERPDKPAPKTCADVTCPPGRHCEVAPVLCLQAPCPSQPQCVPDELPKPFCGGITGTPCPGMGRCKDDPSDNCNPNDGGVDCGGSCVCTASLKCKHEYIFDPSPEVCACTPDPALDRCAALRCSPGAHCEDDGHSAHCVPAAPFCGGIGRIPCPGAGSCVDIPDDNCDPTVDGTDCKGLCRCNIQGLCMRSYEWDPSPAVCRCVPITNPCVFTQCQAGATCRAIENVPVCISDGTLQCGQNTCAKGNVCCNASCSMCAAPGMFCTQQVCPSNEKL